MPGVTQRSQGLHQVQGPQSLCGFFSVPHWPCERYGGVSWGLREEWHPKEVGWRVQRLGVEGSQWGGGGGELCG